MPYTKDNPPAAIKGLPAKAKEIWISAFNAAMEEYKTEEKAFPVAWAAVGKKYKKDADGNWVLKESGEPEGSLEELQNQVRDAFRAWSDQKVPSSGPMAVSSPWIRWTFADAVIVEQDGKLYKLGWTLDDQGVITFDDAWQEVEEQVSILPALEETVTKLTEAGKRHSLKDNQKIKQIMSLCQELLDTTFEESMGSVLHKADALKRTADRELEVVLKESPEKGKGPRPLDITESFSFSMAEATAATDGDWWTVALEAGTYKDKSRHYPIHVVESAVSTIPIGLKMYMNHPTSTEQKERPERDLRDWVSTVVETKARDGKALTKIHIHDAALQEKMQDEVFRREVRYSINAKGHGYLGKIDGQQMQVVESIDKWNSIDWVTEAGAGGRVWGRFLESRRGDKEMLETIKLEDLKVTRPDLVESIKKEVGAPMDDKLSALELKLTESNKTIEEEKHRRQQSETANLVRDLIPKELAARIQTRLLESFRDRAIDTGDVKAVEALKLELTEKVKAEEDYLREVAGPRISGFGGTGRPASAVEDAQKRLDARMGVAEAKKE